jgi:hypothetical protein
MSFIFGWYTVHIKKVFESVEHKYPVSGDIYLVCDREDFGVIEWKTKENLAVYDPEPWGNLDQSAESEKIFNAVRMTQEKHFVSTVQFTNILNFRSEDVHGQTAHLRTVARIIFSKQCPRRMFVGYVYNMFETLQEVNVAKRRRASFGGNDNNLPCVHCERRTISASKLADLKKSVL